MKKKILALAVSGLGMGLGMGLAGIARADVGDAQAAYQDGRCEEAIKALTPTAEAGSATAQKALGDVYMDDERRCQGKSGSVKSAVSWYQRAARADNVEAQRKLVSIYEYGYAKSDPAEATFWMAKVASLGGAGDLSRLATRHEQGEGVPHDRVLAHAFNLLASRRLEKDDDGALQRTLERVAGSMSPEQLAEAESIAASWKPGTPLPEQSATGQRDPRDWYVAAAKAGDLQAAYKAGTLYWQGDYGMAENAELAAFWLRKAAEGGIPGAQYQLSQMYAMGYRVPKDYVLGYVLHMLAAKGGDADAVRRRKSWDDFLTVQQAAEAKALLAKWKKGDALPLATQYGMQRKVNYVDHAYGKLEPTAEVLALFKAASEGDEADFARLLAKVDNINDYLVESEKLLHALLLPAASLRAEANAWRQENNDPRDPAHWRMQQARHAALLPAKTRMLALALERGAVINEGTQRENAAPLHLAAMFGSPEMVRLLLKHGADPRQFGGRNSNLAPLEFALEQKENSEGLPELITPEQRTENLLVLLQAGAPRPYSRHDIAMRGKKDGELKLKRPVADYLLWPSLLALTRGTAVLDAVLKTGTTPADDEDGRTSFDYAAEAGNADAIAWLKRHTQRFDKKKRDRWLDAAMLAMYSSAPDRDKVLQQLLVKDMRWSQQGPREEGYGGNHRTLYGSRERVEQGSLLNHATRARRFEWIPKMAALGAPVNAGGSSRDLAAALEANDIEGVKALLAQGADPLDSMDSMLSLAMKAPDGKDTMLDLLVDHIVRVQKKTLADLRQSPLEDALGGSNGINMPRLRKLLAAGASTQYLSGSAIEAAFGAPDRGVANLLIEHGLLDKAGPNANPDGGTYFVFYAIRTGRTDLLPTIIAHGEGPNHRNRMEGDSVQPNAVEFAISQGNLKALATLLEHGGVIDTVTVQPWGTALDRAVASQSVEMLRMVSKDFSVPLKQACLPSTAHLADLVLNSPDAYWTLLREHGFAKGGACSGIQERMAQYLAESPGILLEGWVGEQVVERLKQLGPHREDFGAETWAAVGERRNERLAGLLARAGWKAPAAVADTAPEPAPQADKAADLALQAKLPGHYYLSGVREVGAELLLRPNGKFEYAMAYGAVDQFAKGSWKVWNQRVVFSSDASPAKGASIQRSGDEPKAAVAAGQMLVDLRFRGKSVPDFKVALLGDAPRKAEGTTGPEGWQTAFSGPLRQIAVSHRQVEGGKWLVYAVAPGDAQRSSYVFDVQAPDARQDSFDFTLDVRDDSLILERDGREMEFQKH